MFISPIKFTQNPRVRMTIVKPSIQESSGKEMTKAGGVLVIGPAFFPPGDAVITGWPSDAERRGHDPDHTGIFQDLPTTTAWPMCALG